MKTFVKIIACFILFTLTPELGLAQNPGTTTPTTFATFKSPVFITPNPTFGPFTVRGTKVCDLVILDQNGNEVYQSDRNENDISLLPSGGYLVRIEGCDGEIYFLKILKI